MEVSKLKLPKFEGEKAGWSEWKDDFEACAHVAGVGDVLRLDAEEPSGEAARAVWVKASQSVYSMLILCTKGTPRAIVKKHLADKNGAAAWRALVKKYE